MMHRAQTLLEINKTIMYLAKRTEWAAIVLSYLRATSTISANSITSTALPPPQVPLPSEGGVGLSGIGVDPKQCA